MRTRASCGRAGTPANDAREATSTLSSNADTSRVSQPKNGVTPGEAVSVKAFCAKCESPIGEFYNSWVSVTKSYHLPTLPGSYHVEHLKSSGVSQAALGGTELTGAEVSSMYCETCNFTLAIECTKAPPHRSIFHNQLFFKLPKLIFRDPQTGRQVDPHMDGVTIAQLQSSGQFGQPEPSVAEEAPLQSTPPPEVVAPPIRASSQTKNPSEPTAQDQPRKTSDTRRSQPAPDPADVEMPDVPASPVVSSNHKEFAAELKSQGAQIDRIEQTVLSLTSAVESLREEVQSLRNTRYSVDDGTLDVITESVSNLSAKVGMVDSLNLGLQVLKRKVLRLEEQTGYTSGEKPSPSPAATPSFRTPAGPPASSRREPSRLANRTRSLSPAEQSPQKRMRAEEPIADLLDDDNMDEDFLESHSGLLDSFRTAPKPGASPTVGTGPSAAPSKSDATNGGGGGGGLRLGNSRLPPKEGGSHLRDGPRHSLPAMGTAAAAGSSRASSARPDDVSKGALKEMFPDGIESRKKQLDPANHFRNPQSAET